VLAVLVSYILYVSRTEVRVVRDLGNVIMTVEWTAMCSQSASCEPPVHEFCR
jgi:hypothetical protein